MAACRERGSGYREEVLKSHSPQGKAHTSVEELVSEAKWTELRAKTILVGGCGRIGRRVWSS